MDQMSGSERVNPHEIGTPSPWEGRMEKCLYRINKIYRILGETWNKYGIYYCLKSDYM